MFFFIFAYFSLFSSSLWSVHLRGSRVCNPKEFVDRFEERPLGVVDLEYYCRCDQGGWEFVVVLDEEEKVFLFSLFIKLDGFFSPSSQYSVEDLLPDLKRLEDLFLKVDRAGLPLFTGTVGSRLISLLLVKNRERSAGDFSFLVGLCGLLFVLNNLNYDFYHFGIVFYLIAYGCGRKDISCFWKPFCFYSFHRFCDSILENFSSPGENCIFRVARLFACLEKVLVFPGFQFSDSWKQNRMLDWVMSLRSDKGFLSPKKTPGKKKLYGIIASIAKRYNQDQDNVARRDYLIDCWESLLSGPSG